MYICKVIELYRPQNEVEVNERMKNGWELVSVVFDRAKGLYLHYYKVKVQSSSDTGPK